MTLSKRTIAALLVIVAACPVAFSTSASACEQCGGKSKTAAKSNARSKTSVPKPAVLLPGVGNLHHPVSTRNALAQKFFDQGLMQAYGFNHDEARRSFERAAQLDPQLAMAHWGIALVLGSNYNLQADGTAQKAAYAALQKAHALAQFASPPERDYIAALAKRYVADPNADANQLANDYKIAMFELAKKYPDDLDATTLAAESAMNLRPWQLWSLAGKPAEGTEELVGLLESVLKRDPDHIGANHLYIHAVEASLHPERAISSANRLARLAPASGHLVHMPAHIYIRTGDYDAAARSNVDAAAVDRAYLESSGQQSLYTMMYYSHNMHFLAVSHAMQGRFADAKKAGDQLGKHLAEFVIEMPPMEFFAPTSTLVLVRFRRWNEVLRAPAPDRKLLATSALWRFSRGMAYAATGKLDLARSERRLFGALSKNVDAATPWDQNVASDVLAIAGHVLDSRIAAAAGDKAEAFEYLRKAIAIEDTLKYAEPAGWYLPTRESLGAMLFFEGKYAEAEQVFRDDLEKNPRNGRSLFGLTQALEAQGNVYAARLMNRQFEVAWKNADTRLSMKDL